MICCLSAFGVKRTLASDRHPIAIYEYALARASQLGGDLEAEGPRLARRNVVVGTRRGPIPLVEDVLDIELRGWTRVTSKEQRKLQMRSLQRKFT